MEILKQFITKQVTKLIKSYLSNFFTGFETPSKTVEKLNAGSLILSNLKIKPEAFDSLNLGFSFINGIYI
jgi:hypothetical protein